MRFLARIFASKELKALEEVKGDLYHELQVSKNDLQFLKSENEKQNKELFHLLSLNEGLSEDLESVKEQSFKYAKENEELKLKLKLAGEVIEEAKEEEKKSIKGLKIVKRKGRK